MRYVAVFLMLMFAYVPAYAQILEWDGLLENDHVQLTFDTTNYTLVSLKDKDNSSFIVNFSTQVRLPLWRLRVFNTSAVQPYVWNEPDYFGVVQATDVSSSRSYLIEGVETTEQVLHLDWTNFPLPYGGNANVNVEVRLPVDSSESIWTISVTTTGDTDALWRVFFPAFLLDPIEPTTEDDLAAVPMLSGLLVPNPHVNNISGIGGSEISPEGRVQGGHPGLEWAMQWMQIYDKSSKHGVFLRSTDGVGYTKGMSMFPYSDPDPSNPDPSLVYPVGTVMLWRHYPENNNKPLPPPPDSPDSPVGFYSPPYDVRLRPLLGDWFDAAKLYRSWLLEQTWTAGGPIETRSDFPQETFESRLLGLHTELFSSNFPIGTVQEVIDSHEDWRVFFDEGILWTLTTHLRNNVFSLEYQLPEPDITLARVLLKELNAKGIRSAPYTNTQGWPRSIEDTTGTLATAVAKTLNWNVDLDVNCDSNENCELNVNCEWFCSPKFDTWKMCPGARQWRGKYLEITNAFVNAGSDDGTTDQYCDLYPTVRLCFDTSHGHPVGGGRWWIDGYREQMLDARLAARSAPNREDFSMAPEHRSETGLDIFDAYVVNYWTYGGKFSGTVFRGAVTKGIPTPIIAATIHDYIGCLGSMGVSYLDIRYGIEDGSQHFRFAQGFNLVHGNSLDLYHQKATDLVIDESVDRDIKYLKDLAHHRRAAMKFLLYGEYLRPPDTGSETQSITMYGENFEQPVILGGAFRASDGSLGVFMTNYNLDNLDSPPADFTISNEDYALGNSTYEIYSFDPAGQEFYGGFNGADYVRTWIFNALDILMLDVVSALDADIDGMSDRWEEQYGLEKDDPADASGDIDADGLSNLEEFQNGCNPKNADTDGGGVSDLNEVARGTDPRHTNYTITATAGDDGRISPSGDVMLDDGANQTFTITPNRGFRILDVLVEGVSVGAVSTYTFTNVTSDHTISVTFERRMMDRRGGFNPF